MKKWIINHNGKETTYSSYNEAVNEYLRIISEHFWGNSDNNKNNGSTVYDIDLIPSSLGAYFSYKFDNRSIPDEEIVLYNRLGLLLSYFLSEDKEKIKDNTNKVITHSYSYHNEESEISTKVDIELTKDKEDLTLDIKVDDGDINYLKSNGFSLVKNDKKYYLNSFQYISTSNNPDDLGKTIELNIYLSPVEDN